MALAAKIPYDHPFAGGYPGIGSQPLPTDSDCLTYLSAVETGVAVAVDAFFRDSKAAGVFDALKACCILAGARTLAGALVPVVGDAPTNVADGFVEGDFSRTSGLTGDGTSYIDSGRANDDDPQNDQHMAVYVQSPNTGSTGAYIGNADTSGSTVIGSNPVNLHVFARSQSVNADTYGNGSETGFIGLTRSSSASYTFRLLSANQDSNNASSVPTGFTSLVFARDQDGTAINITDATIAFYSIGTSLSLEDLDTAVSNLINRLKFALLVGENPSGLDPDTIDYIVRGYEAGGSLE